MKLPVEEGNLEWGDKKRKRLYLKGISVLEIETARGETKRGDEKKRKSLSWRAKPQNL